MDPNKDNSNEDQGTSYHFFAEEPTNSSEDKQSDSIDGIEINVGSMLKEAIGGLMEQRQEEFPTTEEGKKIPEHMKSDARSCALKSVDRSLCRGFVPVLMMTTNQEGQMQINSFHPAAMQYLLKRAFKIIKKHDGAVNDDVVQEILEGAELHPTF